MYLSYGHKKNFVPHGPAAGVISIFPGWGEASSLYILLYKQHARVATCVSYNTTQQTRNKNLHIYYTYINHFHYL